jgi:hypothetical protein
MTAGYFSAALPNGCSAILRFAQALRFVPRCGAQVPQNQADRERGTQPAFTVISKGWLRALHREKDDTGSKPYRPFHSHEKRKSLVPSEIGQLEI